MYSKILTYIADAIYFREECANMYLSFSLCVCTHFVLLAGIECTNDERVRKDFRLT